MRVGNAQIGVECGQRWWRPSSWKRRHWDGTVGWWRTFPSGIAFGPIMVWSATYPYEDRISQAVKAVVLKEAEAAILAEVLNRVGVRPLDGRGIREWAADRAARLETGEWSTVDEALADWDPPHAIHWVRRVAPPGTAPADHPEERWM